MADSQRLTLIARRGDDSYLLRVQGSGCVLTVTVDPQDPDLPGGVGVWANALDAVTARPGWQEAAGAIPARVSKAASEFIGKPGWCDIDQ